MIFYDISGHSMTGAFGLISAYSRERMFAHNIWEEGLEGRGALRPARAQTARAVSKPHTAARNAGLLIAGSARAVSKPHTGGPNAGLLIAVAASAVSKPHMAAPNAGLLIAVGARAVSKPHLGPNTRFFARAQPAGAGNPGPSRPTATAWAPLNAGMSKKKTPVHVFAARLSQNAGLSKADPSHVSENAGLSKNLARKCGDVEQSGTSRFRHPRILGHGREFSLQGGSGFRHPRTLGQQDIDGRTCIHGIAV
jgi:hypothetical protein